MNESVTIVLQGGIGNQLFQYAAGLAIVNKTNGQLWLNSAELNKHSNKDYRKQLYIRAKASGIDGLAKTSQITWQSNAFVAWSPSDYKNTPVLTLKGYYQYLPAIKEEVLLICKDLLESLSNYRIRLKERYSIEDTSQCGFIHIRRGDFLQYSDIHFVQGKDYYTKAIEFMNNKVKGSLKFFILSDDVNWCKQQEWLNGDGFEIVNEPDELDGLMLMSLCEGGAIIANSTYSWWGAMLGCANKNAPVVYPLKWFKNECPDLFLDNWKSL